MNALSSLRKSADSSGEPRAVHFLLSSDGLVDETHLQPSFSDAKMTSMYTPEEQKPRSGRISKEIFNCASCLHSYLLPSPTSLLFVLVTM